MNGYHRQTAVELAEQAAQAIRQLNHATLDREGLEDPRDAYRVLSELAVLAQRLPQALRQLDRVIQVFSESDRLVMDGGPYAGNPRAAMWSASADLMDAAARADSMGRSLDQAHEAMAFATLTELDSSASHAQIAVGLARPGHVAYGVDFGDG